MADDPKVDITGLSYRDFEHLWGVCEKHMRDAPAPNQVFIDTWKRINGRMIAANRRYHKEKRECATPTTNQGRST